MCGHVRHAVVEGDSSVENASAVHVNFEAQCVGLVADFVHASGFIEGATGHVAGVFEAEEGGLRVVVDFGPDRGSDLFPSEDAILAGSDGARHAAGDGRHGGKLVEINVAAFFANHFVTVVGPNANRDEITHTTCGNEQGRFLVEDLGRAFLKSIDGGIFAVDIVTDLGGGHGLTLFFAGAGDRIAAQVDDAVDRSDAVRIDQLISFGYGVGHRSTPV